MPVNILKLPLRKVLYAGRLWKTEQPIRFSYRETRLWPETPEDPSGEWLVLATEAEENDGWLRFRRPLVLDWGSWRGPKSWAYKLWRLLQRKGPESTQFLHRLRYDGIVTIRWDRPYQILNLTGIDSPWSLETPGILRIQEQCRALYTKEFANLDRQYPRTRDLLTAPELSALFEQHLKLHELEEAHEALWGAWEASTSSPPATHLCGFLSKLGVSGRPLESDSEEQREVGLNDRMQEVVEHQYAFLQALLEQTGKKTVKVYRSIYQQTIQSRWLTTFTREASAWSLSLAEALQGGVTLGAVIPIERLLLVPGTRIAHTPLQEVVVLGSTDVVNVRWEHPHAKQSGRQMLDLDARDEDWLVPQRFAKSALRLARLRLGTEISWEQIRKDLQGFNSILQQVQKWKRFKSEATIRKNLSTPQNLALLQKIAWGEDDAHPASPEKPLLLLGFPQSMPRPTRRKTSRNPSWPSSPTQVP